MGKKHHRSKKVLLDQRAELSDRLIEWNPLGLKLPASALATAYDDLTNSVLGHLMQAGDTVRLEALLANWLRWREGRPTAVIHDVRRIG